MGLISNGLHVFSQIMVFLGHGLLNKSTFVGGGQLKTKIKAVGTAAWFCANSGSDVGGNSVMG